jgi:hypothetical protein
VVFTTLWLAAQAATLVLLGVEAAPHLSSAAGDTASDAQPDLPSADYLEVL